jgi:hypothetical protein
LSGAFADVSVFFVLLGLVGQRHFHGQVNPEAVLKRWDLSGNSKIHLTFTD